MKKMNLALIGYGNVGTGVVKFLQKKKSHIRNQFHVDFSLKAVCDTQFKGKDKTLLGKARISKDFKEVIAMDDIDTVIELVGGLHPAKEIVFGALENGKNVVTANKELIGHYGKKIFALAQKNNCSVYFESAVMAGVPVIKTITEGIAGNQFNGVYGIINGTCNYILSEMARKGYSFDQALKEAQDNGFAETDPTKDINGMDAAHKLSILVALSMGKFIKLKDIYTEGITHISHDDIEYAESLGLTIKLLAIAKKTNNEIEARVHPTLISKEHPLAAINGVFNALLMASEPLGDVLISGEGAGQMAAASGIVSDLINLASRNGGTRTSELFGDKTEQNAKLKIKPIDEISTKFYVRLMAIDKPGVLSKITGVLGKHGIGINSMTQRAHNRAAAVPVVFLTDYTSEKSLRTALAQIHKLSVIKAKPVAIRMEKLR